MPDKNPRSECGCQFVALSSSFAVAPPGRFNRSRIVVVLLPSRASFRALLGAFEIPFGLSEEELKRFLRENGAEICGLRDAQNQGGQAGAGVYRGETAK